MEESHFEKKNHTLKKRKFKIKISSTYFLNELTNENSGDKMHTPYLYGAPKSMLTGKVTG